MADAWLSLRIDETDTNSRAWHVARGQYLSDDCHASIVRRSGAYGAIFRAVFAADGLGGPTAFVDPASLVEASQSVYAQHAPIGRYEPVQTFVHNTNRAVSFHVRFEATGYQSLVSAASAAGAVMAAPVTSALLRIASTQVDALTLDAIRKEVYAPAVWLDSLTTPATNTDDVPLPPPRMVLTVGDLLSMRCVVSNCAIRWGDTLYVPPDSRGGRSGLYMSADVDITVLSAADHYDNRYNGPRRGQSA